MARLHEYHNYAPHPARRTSRWPWLLLAVVLALAVGAALYLVRAGALDLGAVRRDLGFAAPAATGSPPPTAPPTAVAVSAGGAPPSPAVPQLPVGGAAATADVGLPGAASAEPATVASPPPPPPTVVPPAEVATAYVERWSDGDYEDLYDLLSTDARAAIGRGEFVERYQGVVERAGLSELTATVEGPPNLQGEVPIRVDFQSSIVGSFSESNVLPLTREGGGWAVAWTPSLIFKDLGGDGCIDVAVDQPARGAILDRDRHQLAYDGPVHRVGIVPGRIEPAEEGRMLRELSALTGIAEDDLAARYRDADPSWFVPIKDFPEARGDELLNALSDLPGVAVQPATARVYPMGATAAHVTGYVAPVTAEQLAADSSLVQGQIVGQTGVEAGADELLTGEPGGRLIVVQCQTRAERSVIHERSPVPAKDVVLTIDPELQAATDAALSAQPGDVKGSAVVLDPRTGAVLAMVSHPTYDPNGFVLGFSAAERDALADDGLRPLLNRAAGAAYPTGSIFKAITFAAAMEDLDLTGETVYDCPSTFSIEGSRNVWEDWTVANGLPAQGPLTLHQALVNSCNTVFYQLGRDLDQEDEEALPAMAKAFGLGAATDIPYLPEVAGSVPDPRWKLDTFGDYWARGDAVNLAIGQGFLQSTPLQMATAYAAIANGGDLLRPYLVAETIAPKETEQVGVREARGKLPLARATLGELQSALRDQTSDPNGAGSARIFGDFPWPIAGKTGTAENNQDRRGQKPHSWFAAFGPYGSEATIASIVMVENAGEGVGFAAPVTRRIYEAYLETNLATEE